jgi:hypothetical protein
MPHFVPNKSVMTVATGVVVVGAVLTLLYQPGSHQATYHGSASTAADITPALSGSASVAPLNLTVNGVSLPAGSGTTTVPASGGTATVSVNGDSASVTTNGPATVQTSTPSGNVSISVQSTSNTGSNTSVNSSNSTSSISSSFSSTSVNGNGSSSVHVQTNN